MKMSAEGTKCCFNFADNMEKIFSPDIRLDFMYVKRIQRC